MNFFSGCEDFYRRITESMCDRFIYGHDFAFPSYRERLENGDCDE